MWQTATRGQRDSGQNKHYKEHPTPRAVWWWCCCHRNTQPTGHGEICQRVWAAATASLHNWGTVGGSVCRPGLVCGSDSPCVPLSECAARAGLPLWIVIMRNRENVFLLDFSHVATTSCEVGSERTMWATSNHVIERENVPSAFPLPAGWIVDVTVGVRAALSDHEVKASWWRCQSNMIEGALVPDDSRAALPVLGFSSGLSWDWATSL